MDEINYDSSRWTQKRPDINDSSKWTQMRILSSFVAVVKHTKEATRTSENNIVPGHNLLSSWNKILSASGNTTDPFKDFPQRMSYSGQRAKHLTVICSNICWMSLSKPWKSANQLSADAVDYQTPRRFKTSFKYKLYCLKRSMLEEKQQSRTGVERDTQERKPFGFTCHFKYVIWECHVSNIYIEAATWIARFYRVHQ